VNNNKKQQQKNRHMKKLTTLFLAVLFAGKLLFAQSVDEARKNLYYGRPAAAIASLNKVIAANPKNAEAIYWLGQAYLNNNNDIAGAQKVYQDALNSGVNDPWIWVGMGHVELLQGKKDAARQRFEAAITATTQRKKENPDILDAIGRANADGPATAGDPAYAIEKLKRAAELKPNDPDIQVNLGINYLKLGSDQGGNAYEAFTRANTIDPKYALANFRLGRIFESQGNVDKFQEYYNAAVKADPTYAPAYLQLYNYYANRDVNKAKGYLQSYIANTPPDCTTRYFFADYLFRAGQYKESLDSAKAMATGMCSNYPRLKVLYAYDYDRLGDSLQAKQNIESFLSSAPASAIQGSDYELAGKIFLKFPGSESQAVGYLEKAMTSDTVAANRVGYINSIIDMLGKANQPAEQVKWYRRLKALTPELSNRDMYLFADAAIKAKEFSTADSVSRMYIAKYPDQEYGYFLLARGAKEADADSTKGSAFPAVQEYITFLSKDPTKNASKIKSQYYYMASVSADKMKDYAKALEIVKQIQTLDPNDTFANQAIGPLTKAVSGRGASTPAAPSKTKTKTDDTKTKVKTKGK
jgi:tetratricopeptide (TPR) repeat protein